ncbi:MAG TPA: hypothetical protein VKA15_02925, partial [Isosphaeraceae bacterium]|nr:hypothetical protein [Isosphaeraceae bacterium]
MTADRLPSYEQFRAQVVELILSLDRLHAIWPATPQEFLAKHGLDLDTVINQALLETNADGTLKFTPPFVPDPPPPDPEPRDLREPPPRRSSRVERLCKSGGDVRFTLRELVDHVNTEVLECDRARAVAAVPAAEAAPALPPPAKAPRPPTMDELRDEVDRERETSARQFARAVIALAEAGVENLPAAAEAPEAAPDPPPTTPGPLRPAGEVSALLAVVLEDLAAVDNPKTSPSTGFLPGFGP